MRERRNAHQLAHRGALVEAPRLDLDDRLAAKNLEVALAGAIDDRRRPGSLLTRCWRELDSNFWYRGTKAVDFRSIPGIARYRRALKRYHVMVQPFFFCASIQRRSPPRWSW